MARTKLTAGRIRDFTCPADKTQAFLWDTEAPGLAVRATPGSTGRDDSKGKAFIFQGALNGKDLRATIGDVRAWNLDAARTEARRLQTLIDQGIDPREQKRERITAAEAKRAPFDSALPADLIPYGIEHNPVDAIPAIAVRRGDRTLTASELRAYIGHLLRVGQEVGQEADMTNTALLVALYAGGQRVAQLLRAKGPEYMNLPGWRLHPLVGSLDGHYSVAVNGNWRLTFRFDGADAVLVDYQDYH